MSTESDKWAMEHWGVNPRDCVVEGTSRSDCHGLLHHNTSCPNHGLVPEDVVIAYGMGYREGVYQHTPQTSTQARDLGTSMLISDVADKIAEPRRFKRRRISEE